MNQFHVRNLPEGLNVVERLGHFNLIVPSLVRNLMKQHGVCAEERQALLNAFFNFFVP